MKRWLIAFCLVTAAPYIDGEELPYKNIHSGKRDCCSYTAVQASKVDTTAPKKNCALRPRIQQSVWPEFCLQHLTEDPEGCSAWCDDEMSVAHLEFQLEGHSQVQIDRGLIAYLGHLANLIPTKTSGDKKTCDHAVCPSCKQTVVRTLSCKEIEDDKGMRFNYFVAYRCGCTGSTWLDPSNLDKQYSKVFSGWKFCKHPTIYNGYLDWHHQSYICHLKDFLQYSENNPACLCYWSEINAHAKKISDLVYTQLESTFPAVYMEKVRDAYGPYLAERSQHGFYSGLLTHAFFDSHYRTIFLDLDRKCSEVIPAEKYVAIHKQLARTQDDIQNLFIESYNNCLKKHPHPTVYCERGTAFFHRGQDLDSLEDLRKFIAYAETHSHSTVLSSELYLREGQLLNESLSHKEAIVALTKALEKDAQNASAYLERAIAYFEVGDLTKALSDYLASGIRPKKADAAKAAGVDYAGWRQVLSSGIAKGVQESARDFVPLQLGSYKGLSRGIWACVTTPMEVSADMIESASACLAYIKEHTRKELNAKIAPELQECLAKWGQLDEVGRANCIGQVIGKYGVDIFIGSGSIEATQLYRNIRRANTLMTLETAALSPRLVQEIEALAAAQEKYRAELLESDNLKILWSRQGMYMQGHKNYSSAKSKTLFTHHDPQKLVDECTGKGKMAAHRLPGNPIFKEEVNFFEFIGLVDGENKEKIATTWGKICYTKDGVYIVPMHPRG